MKIESRYNCHKNILSIRNLFKSSGLTPLSLGEGLGERLYSPVSCLLTPISLFLLLTISTVSFAQKDSSFYCRSTGKLPSLAYSMGEDRLGSPKMGYIDSGILFHIIDSADTWYKVKLSTNRNGFIDKKYTTPVLEFKPKAIYYSGTITAKGTDSCYDIINVALDERLPYKAWMETNPSIIKLEIYGVHTNTNWITQFNTLKEVKDIYYNQIEEDVMQVTIHLKHQQQWGYTLSYSGNHLLLKIKRQPSVLFLNKMIIAIDAGHGGTNGGADGGKTHIAEKDLTLIYAKVLQQAFKKLGIKTIMTRTTDTTLEMKDRIITMQQKNPDLLISLHFNSSTSDTVKGSSTYYKHIGFRPLTQTILKRMLELKMNEYGNVGNFNFGLNAPTDFVNCLLEVGFLSNPEEEKRLVNPIFQKKVAQQIIKGINDWLLQCK